MKEVLLSDNSKKLIGYLMSNETIANKVKSAGEKDKTYAIYSIKDSGIIVLGETRSSFWNRLIKCQFPLTFEAFCTAVWDALVDLASGNNQEAILKGLSKEVMEKAQRDKKYNWVIERLVDCYRHVCNNKDGADSEGSRGKSGPSVVREVIHNDKDVSLNINVNGIGRKIKYPDATGNASLVFDLGVVGVSVEKD